MKHKLIKELCKTIQQLADEIEEYGVSLDTEYRTIVFELTLRGACESD